MKKNTYLLLAISLLLAGCSSEGLKEVNTVKEEGVVESSTSQEQTSVDSSQASSDTTYTLSGNVSDSLIVSAPNEEVTIHLNGVSMDTAQSCIQILDAKSATIVVEGTNTLKDQVTVSSSSENESANASIYATCPLTFSGTGSLSIDGNNHGIYSNDTIVIKEGTYTIESENDGIKGKDGVQIMDGTVTIQSNDHGIASTKNKDGKYGAITVDGGNIKIESKGDGFHCSGLVQVNGGSLDIVSSQEGIEGYQVELNGGKSKIEASDDGINASDPNSSSSQSMDPNAGASSACQLTITGGEHIISAKGDGLDSNGSLKVSGGKTFVYGPENGGNFALDFNGQGTFEGGLLVATGYSGMIESLSSSTPFIAYSTSTQQANKAVDVKLNGSSLVQFTPMHSWNTVLIYDGNFKSGDTVSVLDQTFTLSNGSNGNVSSQDNFGRQRMGRESFEREEDVMSSSTYDEEMDSEDKGSRFFGNRR